MKDDNGKNAQETRVVYGGEGELWWMKKMMMEQCKLINPTGQGAGMTTRQTGAIVMKIHQARRSAPGDRFNFH